MVIALNPNALLRTTREHSDGFYVVAVVTSPNEQDSKAVCLRV
jgi:hypothetical protein